MTFKARYAWYQHLPDSKLVKVWISDSAWITGQTWYKIHFADTKSDWVRATKIQETTSVQTSV